MRGKRFILEKEEAIKLRKQGFSIVTIEKQLGINRSTLSGWFKDILLTKEQIDKLNRQRFDALKKGRIKAVVWHNLQKQGRLENADFEARQVVEQLDANDSKILDLALAFLYWGEGFKKSLNVGIGNTDPQILKFLIHVLRYNYTIQASELTGQLHLRADQNKEKEILYWSNILGIPAKNFKWTQFDKRTTGKKTYKNYHGVCTIYCYNVAIQRKLINISKQFVEKILKRP